MKKLKVTIEFITDVLGSSPSSETVYRDYVESKSPYTNTIGEEIFLTSVDEVTDKGTTIFPKDKDGRPFFWDYQIRGFFKSACGFLRRCKDESFSKASCKMTAYKKVIDGCIFVEPRQIFIDLRGGQIGNCQRPLRAQTAQGERVALANSESIPADSRITFIVTVMSDAYEKAVREWLAYGRYTGLGQWRNGGHGRFKVLSIEE